MLDIDEAARPPARHEAPCPVTGRPNRPGIEALRVAGQDANLQSGEPIRPSIAVIAALPVSADRWYLRTCEGFGKLDCQIEENVTTRPRPVMAQ